jgi:hypothetical protein
VTIHSRETWMLGSAVALVVVALSSIVAVRLVKRWRAKSPEEIERLRRLDVNRRGRITAAKIVDLIERQEHARASRLVFYKYEVSGVTYEAAQDVAGLSGFNLSSLAVQGLTSSVKYDPRKPTNSIIVCEEWCGVPMEPDAAARTSTTPSASAESALPQSYES